MENGFWVEGEFDQKDIGEIIQVIREDHLKISDEELAKAVDVGLDSLKKCEAGESPQSPALLKTILNKFDLKATIKVTPKSK